MQHIATFYKTFSLVPKGRHEIHVCMGTACHVRGAPPRARRRCEDLTGIKPGETDADMKFSLETVNCLGCCALGPVMEVDGKHHGKMAPAKAGRRAEELRVGKIDAQDQIRPPNWNNFRQDILSATGPETALHRGLRRRRLPSPRARQGRRRASRRKSRSRA